MKLSRYLACLLVYFILASNGDGAPTNSLRLTVELRDGSRVVGKGCDDKFEFRSEIFGKIRLLPEQIGVIEFDPKTNTVQLCAASGDKLSVLMETKEIHVETSFGNVSISRDSIRRLRVFTGDISGRTTAGLVALWSGDGNANDGVGRCNGQLINGVGFTTGKVGQALDLNPSLYSRSGGLGWSGNYSGGRFNRGGEIVLIPAGQVLDVGKGDGLTFECWIKPATVAAQQLICEYANELGTSDSSDVGLLMAIQSSTVLYANVLDVNKTAHEISTPANVLKSGVWQHIALTYEKVAGVASLYVNGKLATQVNIGSFTPQTSFSNLLLGGGTYNGSVSNPNTLFSGGIDEFGVYDRALSTQEIQAICAE